MTRTKHQRPLELTWSATSGRRAVSETTCGPRRHIVSAAGHSVTSSIHNRPGKGGASRSAITSRCALQPQLGPHEEEEHSPQLIGRRISEIRGA